MAKNKPSSIRLLNLGRVPPAQTQAVYHAIAELMRVDTPDTIILCRPQSPYLCLGYHQLYEAVLDRSECERRKIPVYRRRVGGGTTYLDSNQLFYQCVFHHTRVPVFSDKVYARMLAAPVAALRRLGLKAELRAINEIEIDGKRVAGVGGGRIGEASVVVGNLLFDFDYETMAQVWRVPWEAFREMASAALRNRITTLQQIIGQMNIAAVQKILLEEYTRAFRRPIEPGKLTPAENRRAGEIADRLGSEKTLNLHAEDIRAQAMRSLKISAGVYITAADTQLNGHKIQASFRIREKLIEEARLESEPAAVWTKMEAKLRGKAFEQWQSYVSI